MADQENLQDPLVERPSASPEPPASPTISKKRKRNPTKVTSAGEAPVGKKKKKPKTKAKAKAIEEDELDLETGINKAFSHMDSQLLADYVAQRTRRYESDLSSIELEDKGPSNGFIAKAIEDTTAWDKTRNLDNLPGFLEKFAGNSTKLWSASKKNGSPHTIIVTAAGLRAAEIARVVRKLQTKDATVAKLFAKHIKLQDSVKFLKTTRTGVAVGTPTRLKDLMDDGLSLILSLEDFSTDENLGALAVDRLERIVIDASHIDVKKRGILEMKETQVPLIFWLGQSIFKERYAADKNGIQLLFY
ncbi:Protein CMS1 [Lachnellula subtilissima]|uniref:Protein CMS1 n=1 Tax=Lachnellula subtilissima TaxID=602034 RepID=A0A8H8RSR9_9HELO|nr:Protein CMS1 [Lachnellula subtilissima]